MRRQHVAAVVHDGAVAVGEQPGARVVRADRARRALRSVSTAGCHVLGVERAGDLERDAAGALPAGRPARAASCSSVPAATTWPAPLSLAAVRPCSSSVARTSSRSPPSTAVMPVRRERGGLGHGAAALADEDHRLLGRDHARAGGGGDLADAVAGADADASGARRRGAGTARAAATRPAATSSGWATAVSRIVSASASVPKCDQVQAGAGGQPAAAGLEAGELEPGSEEAGRLGALAGSDDDEHRSTASGRTRCRVTR